MKTCNDGGYCQHKCQEGSMWGCKFEGYCDYQRPKDSRPVHICPNTFDPTYANPLKKILQNKH